jgi:ribosomal protein L37E
MVLAELKEKQKAGKVQNKKKILCKNCGNNNPISSSFCNSCGAQLNSQVTSTTSNNFKSSNNELPDQEFYIYENLGEGFRIQYPSDWIVLDEQQERPRIVDFLSPLEDASDNYREPFGILKFIYNFIFSINDFVNNELNSLNKDNDVKVI